jgi:hypothetical protein
MATSMRAQLQVLRALVEDSQLSDALTARVTLIQSLVQQVIAHLEQQPDPRTIEPLESSRPWGG